MAAEGNGGVGGQSTVEVMKGMREEARKEREATQDFLKSMVERVEALEKRLGERNPKDRSCREEIARGKKVIGEGNHEDVTGRPPRIPSVIVASMEPTEGTRERYLSRPAPESSNSNPREEDDYGEEQEYKAVSKRRRTEHRSYEEASSTEKNPEDRLKKLVRKEVRKWKRDADGARNGGDEEAPSPFTKDVLAAEFPRRFSLPTIDIYKGHTDPKSHVEKFELLMEIHGVNGDARCRIFPLTLGGSALLWFRNLRPRSINGFVELRRSFLHHFKGAAVPKRTVGALRTMKQRDDEPLRSFLDRYHVAVLEIGAYESPEALESFKAALKVGRLWSHLRIQEISDYPTALEHARRFVQLEEEERIARGGPAREKKERLNLRRDDRNRKGPGGRGHEFKIFDRGNPTSEKPHPVRVANVTGGAAFTALNRPLA